MSLLDKVQGLARTFRGSVVTSLAKKVGALETSLAAAKAETEKKELVLGHLRRELADAEARVTELERELRRRAEGDARA